MTGRTPAQLFPPGAHLREELEARDLTPEQLARMISQPLRWVNEFLVGNKRITPEAAKALGQALGTGPEIWLNLEKSYRSSLAAKGGVAAC